MEFQERSITFRNQGFYDRYGYLVLPFHSDQICDQIIELFEGLADPDFKAIMNPDREFDKKGFVEKAEVVRSIIRNLTIIEILEVLQGVEVCALMSQVLFKRVGTPYAAQAWNPHQDNSYPRAKDGTYITINIFLSDADCENGCLYLYPGSHKEGLLPFEPMLSYRENPGMNPGNHIKQISSRYKKTDLLVKKGDLLIMNGNLVHGSYPNISSTRSRPLFSVSYINFGVPFWPGDPARSDKRVMRLR